MTSGVPAPNSTQVPNVFFDEILPNCTSLSELKLLLIIIRQTFGYNKGEDMLSLSQLEAKTGMTRQSVINGIVGCERNETITRKAQGDSFSYGLRVVKNLDYPVPEGVVKNLDPHSSSIGFVDFWNRNMGCMIPKTTLDLIDDLESRRGVEFLIEAVEECVRHNVRTPAYFERVVINADTQDRKPGQRKSEPAPDPLNDDWQYNQPINYEDLST